MTPNRDLHAALQRLNAEAYKAAVTAHLAGETELHVELCNVCFWLDDQVKAAAQGVEVSQ